MSMKQNAFLDQSILIASNIEDELAVLSKRKSRGVKQAGFWVLYKTAMPSLLARLDLYPILPKSNIWLRQPDRKT
jgi:N-acetylmuramoyl-L-alanine amidase